jgi:hypothetical protein
MDFDFDRCVAEARARLETGATTEDLLRFFRQSGATMPQSMRLLGRANNIGLGDAKRVVHFSETWKDFRESSEQLHEEAERVAFELAGNESSIAKALPNSTPINPPQK